MCRKSIYFLLMFALTSTSYGVLFQGDLDPADGAYILGNWEMPGSHKAGRIQVILMAGS